MVERTNVTIKRTNCFNLDFLDNQVLLVAYLPLIGGRALNLYQMLYELTGGLETVTIPTILLIDFLSEENLKDQDLNEAIKILVKFKLVKTITKTSFDLYPPYTKDEYKNSSLFGYLKENSSEIEFEYICKLMGWINAKDSDYHTNIPSSDLSLLTYKNKKRKNIPFAFDVFNQYAKEAGYNIEGDEDFFQSLASLYQFSLDQTLTILHENSDENNQYKKDDIILAASKRLEENNAKMSAKNSDDVDSDKEAISYFEKTKPEDILRSNVKGGQVAKADYSIIERLRQNLSLSDELISILLAYSIATSSGRINSYPFFEKIALDWRHNKIINAEDAFYYISDLYHKTKTKKKTQTISAEEWYKNYWDKIITEEKR